MKKWKLLSVTALTLLLLTGCQNPDASDVATEHSENHKEQQVTSLTKKENDSANTSAPSKESVSIPDTDDSGEFYGDTLDSLTESVNDIVQKIDNVTVSGNNNKDHEAFIKLNRDLEEIENKLDYYEENMENDFEQGRLSYDEARETEFKIEKLEDKLDRAEETLEYTFGYDD